MYRRNVWAREGAHGGDVTPDGNSLANPRALSGMLENVTVITCKITVAVNLNTNCQKGSIVQLYLRIGSDN